MRTAAEWWRIFRPIVAIAIIGGVGIHFYQLLTRPELQATPLAWRWNRLLFSGLLFIPALSCWGMFWARLVRRIQPGTTYGALLRAYLGSLVGKYVPGKALVIVVRAASAYFWGVPAVISALMTVYETMT